ncbi:MAG: polymerase, sigma-24 subunit, subfamily, partial [Verrucomicrobia bacterium]|nr:polymerase, sigma-24 subunit, subfamily [Verrucomicrobiota bacterium]
MVASADSSPPQPSIHELAQREARWFREEIEAHEADLRAYLRSRFASLPDTDDIIQDAYAKLLKLREGGSVAITRAYLFVVA